MTRSASDPDFLATVTRWFDEQSELLVLIRYSRMAGSKDFYLPRSLAEFQSETSKLSPSTSLIVFRQPHLPLRGVIDADFIEAACALIPDGSESLIVMEKRDPYYNSSQHFAGETHEELREHLTDEMGEKVAVGLYPDWLEDNDDVTSAIVPNADGTVTQGVY